MNLDLGGLAFVEVCERDLDFALAEEIECNHSFRSWFFEQTGAAPNVNELVRLRRSVSTPRYGETDLLVVHRNADGSDRALLIENKIVAPFMPRQPERYRERGREGTERNEWKEFATVLFAPERRFNDVDPAAFDYRVSYEECVRALSGGDSRTAFKCRIFQAACRRARVPSDPAPVDPEVVEWFSDAWHFGLERFPDLPLPPETGNRAPGNYWIGFCVRSFSMSRVAIEIKPHLGIVDLRLLGIRIGDLRREFGSAIPEGAITVEAKSGKSVAIRTQHPKMAIESPFSGQADMLYPMLASADRLHKFALDHQAKISQLL